MSTLLSKVKNSVKKRRRSSAGGLSEEVAKGSAAKRKKRRNGSISADQTPGIDDQRVAAFREWCREVGIVLHPGLYIGCGGSCADIGVVATEDIAEGEQLAFIPRSALLNSANSHAVHRAMERDKLFQKQLPEMTSWVPLLIALIAEYAQKSESQWSPYLSLVPNNEHAGPPMLWGECERGRLLQGTGVGERVERDLERIEHDFKTIVLPFMQRHPRKFRKTFHSQQLYEKLVSFVMSYSFTDSGEADIFQRTMMVPFVDLLNHHSQHHAELEFREEFLELVTVREIRAGEEVMNTYGPLPNASLLHIYGFTEPGNPHDMACVSSSLVKEVYLECKLPSTLVSRERRWKDLEKEGLLESEYEINCKGEPENGLLTLEKLLFVKEKAYQQMKRQLLESSSESDSSEDSTSNAVASGIEVSISSLKHKEIKFLRRLVEHCLEQYPEDYETNMRTARNAHSLSHRERVSLHLCMGQQKCLMTFTSCSVDIPV